MTNDDITHNYHGGNQQSVAANKRTNKARDRARIYAHIHTCGMYGSTSDECEVALDMGHQTCSARFTDMKCDGLLIPIGIKRKTRHNCDAEVCVAKGIWDAQAAEQRPESSAQQGLFDI